LAHHTLPECQLVHECGPANSVSKVHVYLLTLLCHHRLPLANDVNRSSLLAPDLYLQALLVPSYLIDLLLEVDYQPLYHLYQLVLPLHLHAQPSLLLPQVLAVHVEGLDLPFDQGTLPRDLRRPLLLLPDQLAQPPYVVLDLPIRVPDYLRLLLCL
jgi:hypothetical protein